MMKYSISSSAFLITIFLFLILLSSPALSSRSTIATTPTSDAAATTTSIEEVKRNIEETEEGSAEIMSLMGWEVCKDNNGEDVEECLRRRVVSEAHLDYIYTQQHKH